MDQFMIDFDEIDDFDNSYVSMKCLNCGYEEDMPSWCYDEVAYMLKLDDPNEEPHIVCPRCNEETLFSKKYYFSKIN